MSVAKTIATWLGHELRPLHKSESVDQHVARFLRKHEIALILDCGAFVGTFARNCRKAGYRGAILSFEPSSRQFEHLARAAARDPGWIVQNIAVGDRSGEATMGVSTGIGALNSLYRPQSGMRRHFWDLEIARDEKVTIRRLDEVLDERKIATDVPLFLKSDTQGHDLAVLRGAGTRLTQVQGLLLEMSVQPLYQGTPSHWDVLEFARKAGFEPYGFSTLCRDEFGGIIEYDALFARPRCTR